MNLIFQNLSQFDNKKYSPKVVSDIFLLNFSAMLAEFYEMQTQFLTSRYKINENIESSNILTFLGRSLHLEILRQRQNNLNFDVSLKNFLKMNEYIRNNLDYFNHGHNIVSIVKETGIPKETVRRKLNKLIEKKIINYDKKNKFFSFNISEKNEKMFADFIEEDIRALSKFILFISNALKINLEFKEIETNIKDNFSFYYYHYYNYQLKWLKMWRKKIKDLDLIIIAIQALIPTLKNKSKKIIFKSANRDNVHTLIGKNNIIQGSRDFGISAASISEVTNISRATCIRKLKILVKLGMLIREEKSKRYFVNQTTNDRTRNIVTKENVDYTISIFSEFISLAINNILSSKK